MALAKSPETVMREERKAAATEAAAEAETTRASISLNVSVPQAVKTLSQCLMQQNAETMKKILNLVDVITPTEVQHVKARRQVLDAFNDQERFMRAAVRRVLAGEVTVNE